MTKEVTTYHFSNLLDLERFKLIYEWIPNGIENALDVGCNVGYFTTTLLNKARRVCAIDIDNDSIKAARERYSEIDFKVSSGETIPYEDDFFDLVVMSDVLEHTQDDEGVIKEVSRVLRPGGILIITVPYKELFSFLDPINLVFNPIFYLMGFFIENLPLSGILIKKFRKFWNPIRLHRHYSLATIKTILGTEFKIKKIYRGGLLIYALSHLLEEGLYYIIFFSRLIKIPLIRNLFYRLTNMLARIRSMDYQISYGVASYNLAIYASKNPN